MIFIATLHYLNYFFCRYKIDPTRCFLFHVRLSQRTENTYQQYALYSDLPPLQIISTAIIAASSHHSSPPLPPLHHTTPHHRQKSRNRVRGPRSFENHIVLQAGGACRRGERRRHGETEEGMYGTSTCGVIVFAIRSSSRHQMGGI